LMLLKFLRIRFNDACLAMIPSNNNYWIGDTLNLKKHKREKGQAPMTFATGV